MAYPYPPTSPSPLDDATNYWQSNNSRSPTGSGSNTPRLSGYGLSRQPSAGLPTANFNTNRLSPFFNNHHRTLPMYKDKPYFAPRRTGPRSRRRKAVYTGVCAFFVTLLWWYVYGPIRWGGFGVRTTDWAKGAELYEWVQSLDEKPGVENSGKHVDWEARREKVRDAMIVSWDGYEKYGWGELSLLLWVAGWPAGLNTDVLT